MLLELISSANTAAISVCSETSERNSVKVNVTGALLSRKVKRV